MWGKLWTKPLSPWGLFARQRQRVHGVHVDPTAGFRTWCWAVTVCKTKSPIAPPAADPSAEEATRCHQVPDRASNTYCVVSSGFALVLVSFSSAVGLIWVRADKRWTPRNVLLLFIFTCPCFARMECVGRTNDLSMQIQREKINNILTQDCAWKPASLDFGLWLYSAMTLQRKWAASSPWHNCQAEESSETSNQSFSKS